MAGSQPDKYHRRYVNLFGELSDWKEPGNRKVQGS